MLSQSKSETCLSKGTGSALKRREFPKHYSIPAYQPMLTLFCWVRFWGGLLFSLLFYFVLLCSTLHGSVSALLYSIILCRLYSLVPYPTPPYPILPYSTLLHYSTLPCSTQLCSALLCSTLFLPYSTVLYPSLLYSTALYSTLLYSVLLYSAPPYPVLP